jgi:hypothetical protein
VQALPRVSINVKVKKLLTKVCGFAMILLGLGLKVAKISMRPDKVIKIHKVARELGVSIQTIKNYENAGLLPKARRDGKGWRYYTEEDLIKIKALYSPELKRS